MMQNSYLPTFLNSFPGHLYWFNTKGIVLGCNQACATFFGYSNSETTIGLDIYEIMIGRGAKPAHIDQMRKDNARVYQGEHITVEETVIKDGNEIIFLSYKYPLLDDQDKIIGIIGTSLDITEQKKREAKLVKENFYACQENKSQNIYLKNILNAQLPVSFYWMDKEGTILGCNEAQAHIYNFASSKELIGKSTYFLRDYFGWSDEMCDAIRRNDIAVMETGKTIIKEENVTVNGEERTYLSHKSPLINDEGEVIGVFGFSSDITERKMVEVALTKAMEKSEALSTAKTEFIRNMSHDIRTPLSGIIGMANMIHQAPHAVETKEGALDIHQAASALLNLLNEIIETTQLESGDITHEKKCFALKTTIDALTAIFRPAIKQKGLALETFYDDNIPEILFGQELLLHRIVLNLLGNAVKFTTHGTISLEVSLSKKNIDKAILKIVIQDTGSGIPGDKQEVIFDKFSRLTPSYTSNYSGSGLGLYMVKEYIKKLGGDIKVNSTLGNGAQFICNVQFKIPTKAQLKKYQPIPVLQPVMISKPVNGEKLRVLLVEDTLLPRKIAKSLLNIEGYKVVTAETAKEAIEKSTQNKFDLIYMDIGLPDGTGIEVARAIRANPENPNRDTFIVALTAHSDSEIKKECLNAGMQEVFDKPLNLNKIEVAELGMNSRQKSPVMDLKSITQAMGGDNALAKEVLSMFMAELPSFQKQIEEAFTKKDLVALKHHIHKLHGALCYSGLPHLKAVVSTFEKQLINQMGNYDESYQNLIQEIEISKSEYNKLSIAYSY